MTTFALIGGSGTLGRHIATALAGPLGDEVRVVSRHSPSHPADLTTGRGLAAALAGADVVLDASNGPPRRPEPVLAEGARRLQAEAARAGVGHLVLVSIVGIDQVPMGYYRAKVSQEAVHRAGEVPWTVVRSTQFHELLDGVLATLARMRVSPRLELPLRPVAAAEAGRFIAEIAREAPRFATVTVAGPEETSLSALARDWSEVRGRRLLPVALPVRGVRGARALRAGALSEPAPDRRGRMTFAAWLRARAGGGLGGDSRGALGGDSRGGLGGDSRGALGGDCGGDSEGCDG